MMLKNYRSSAMQKKVCRSRKSNSHCCLVRESEELDQTKLRRIIVRKRRKRRRIVRLTCAQTTDVNPSSTMSSSCDAMPRVVT
jgi:hypothetical protein